MPIMDRRKLLANYYMIVEGISFASDAIGAAVGGRTAQTVWAEGANLIFKGQLRHHLIFALMAFDIVPTSLVSPERFSLIPERKFNNPGTPDPKGVQIVDIDPATSQEGIVTLDDVAFLDEVTGLYRYSWDESVGIVAENRLTPATKNLYYGSRLATLAYGLQYSDTPAPIYTEFDFAFFDRNSVGSYITLDDILGSNGPTELERAHVSLGNLILGA
jgi:hypothetical protein